MQDPASGPDRLAEPQPDFDEPVSGRRFQFSPLTFLFGFGAGAFVGVALAILAFQIADDNQKQSPGRTSIEADLADAVVSGTPQPTPDTRPKSKMALDVRLGPGSGFAIVGSLARGESVEVVGRDNDSQWLAIRFPPGSAGQGWIPVSGVDGLQNLNRFAVALPTPLPRTISTFPAGGSLPGEDSGPAATAAATRASALSGTATPIPGPADLVVTRVSLLADNHVSVTVSNRGPGDVVGFTVFVQVRDLGARSEVMSAPVSILRIGQTLTVQTSSFQIDGEETIQAIVDPFGSVPEVDRTNNTMQVVLAAPPTATPTPRPVTDGPI